MFLCKTAHSYYCFSCKFA
uniref:Uncharacterized protein n=1 Tax=Arundo donax TaxID=35708 RepID=A0A0A9F2M4_ARUDO